jgi:hypothetical protein
LPVFGKVFPFPKCSHEAAGVEFIPGQGREGSRRAVGAGDMTMTSEQSKKLQVGTRVCFNGNAADGGKVIAIQARYVTIKWDDGHQSLTGHNDMARVELLVTKK